MITNRIFLKNKRAILIFAIVITGISLGLFKVSNFLNRNSPQISQSVSVVKGLAVSQRPAVPGQPISWTVKVSASAINAGQHLLEIPKSAEQVKITSVNKSQTKKLSASEKVSNISSTLTAVDRKKLSELSKQNAESPTSLVLAESLKNQNDAKAKLLALEQRRSSAGFFGRMWYTLAGSLSQSMTASVEDAVTSTGPAETPAPEVTVIDITPEAPAIPKPVQSESTPLDNPTSSDEDLTGSTDTSTQNTDQMPVTPPEESETPTNTTSVTPESTPPNTSVSTSSDTNEPDQIISAPSATSTTTATTSPSSDISSSSGSSPTSSGGTLRSSSKPETATTSTSTSTRAIPASATTTLVVTEDVLVEYETPAPTIAEATTDTGKIVTVSDDASGVAGTHTTNVLAFTNIPEIYKVGQEHKIQIKWLNNDNQEMEFHAFDLNKNGKLDYVEWTVPHLSTQTFEIIFITKALELDENGEIFGDIYDDVKDQDNTWASISLGHTVRVTFEKFLTRENDNTIYAKSTTVGTSAQIEVYPVYDGVRSAERVAIFDSIDSEKIYKVILTGLLKSTDVFDLKVVGGGVDIDFIVDPSPITVTDTFDNSSKIASAINVTVDTANGQVILAAASTWTCGSPLFDSRDGKSYNTVLIGSQCWMQQNLNIGTMVTSCMNGYVGTCTTGGSTVRNQGTSTSTIQKYCYNDTELNCTNNGGFYQWDQAMGGSTTLGARGICPAGWHIPTHDEFTLLERTTCTSGSCATDFPYDITTTGWRGTNEGTTLKNVAGLFRGLLTGYRNTDGSFLNIGAGAVLWSSLQSGGSAWRRALNSGNATVHRATNAKAYGFSVRCLKD
ncbi:MAG: FISUMP domain-containing protein [Candidatus Paceibacterota bacterium]|jgi:uncharacterized protein (TIGR02145 family)